MEEIDISAQKFIEFMNGNHGQEAVIIDVREDFEWDDFHLEDAVHLPMNTIPGRLAEIPRDKELYIICAHGVRSATVCRYLLANGFRRLKNVQGGMASVELLKGFVDE